MKHGGKQFLAALLALILILALLPMSALAATGDSGADGDSEAAFLDKLDRSQIKGLETDYNNVRPVGKYNPQSFAQEEIAVFDENELFVAIVELKTEPLGAAARQMITNSPAAASVRARQEAIVAEQQAVFSDLKRVSADVELGFTYTALMNGFSAVIRYKDVALLKADPRVAAVYQSQVFKVPETRPQDSSSNDMVWASSAWASDYKGDGMLISIIDTGVDYLHPLLNSLDSEHMFSREDMELRVQRAGIINARNYSGTGYYKNSKVIFGYDYADNDDNPMDDESGHGTHVAGIAAANTDEEGIVIGVAPNAQIMAMKVEHTVGLFAGSLSEAGILAAVEDSFKLGADVANLSLGMSAGFTTRISGLEELPYEKAFTRAREAGMGLIVAAGNDTTMGAGSIFNQRYGISNPTADYTDYGIVGSPSTFIPSLSVASFDNRMMYSNSFRMGEELYPFESPQNGLFINTFDGQTLAYVAVPGLGEPEDYDEIDVAGKVALIQRGQINFSVKVNTAADHGAIGVIIYNNVEGFIGGIALDDNSIPTITIRRQDGEAMAAMGAGSIEVSKAYAQYTTSATGGYLSDFSSWGVTPDLKIKPEISAPGGEIYATIPTHLGSFGVKGGTSMAAPHVAGGYALVRQHLREYMETLPQEGQLSPTEMAGMLDSILMSTAQMRPDPNGNPYSVKAQGSGMMDLDRATRLHTILYNPENQKSKVELGDHVDPDNITVSFRIYNYSDAAARYSVQRADSVLITDDYERFVSAGEERYFNAMASRVLGYASEITVDGEEPVGGEFSLPAFGEATITATFSVPRHVQNELDGIFTNGYFAEGFVAVRPLDGEAGDMLSLPFLGYVGDWQKASAFDSRIVNDKYYEEADLSETPFFWENALYGNYDENGNAYMHPLGVNLMSSEWAPRDHVAFSPVATGVFDWVSARLGMLRNVKNLRMEIKDADGTVFYNRVSADYLRKSVSQNGSTIYQYLSTYNAGGLGWYGTTSGGQRAPDGLYTVTVYGSLDYGAPESSRWSADVFLDSTAPEVSWEMQAENGRYILRITAKDNHKLQSLLVTEGTMFLAGRALMGYDEYVYDYDLTDYVYAFGLEEALKKIAIYADDYGQNIYWEYLEQPGPIVTPQFTYRNRVFEAGLPFLLEFSIGGENIEAWAGRKVTVYLRSESARISEDVVFTLRPGELERIAFDNMPASNSVRLQIDIEKGSSQSITLYSFALPENMWNPAVSETEDNKIKVSFAARLSGTPEVTVAGAVKPAQVTGSDVVIDAPYADGAELILTGVSFKGTNAYGQQYFASNTFTFRLVCPIGGMPLALPGTVGVQPLAASALPAQFNGKTVTYDTVDRIMRTSGGSTVANLGENVREIAPGAFAYRKTLTEVNIEAGLTKISDYAFYGCTNLSRIVFEGDQALQLGKDLFAGVEDVLIIAKGALFTQLQQAYMDAENVHLQMIPKYTVAPTVTPADGGDVTGGRDYYEGSLATLVATPRDGFQFVGWFANSSAVEPLSVDKVYAFTVRADNLTPEARFVARSAITVTFTPDRNGNTLTAAGVKAQLQTSGITGLFVAKFDPTVTYIDHFAFAMNKELAGVEIGDTVTEIGALAFLGCDRMTDASIGAGVTEMGDLTFFYCRRLTAVTIGAQMAQMGRDAFSACAALETVAFAGTGEIRFSDYTFDLIPALTLRAGGSLYTQLQAMYENNSKITVELTSGG